jgi:uncharacterized protein (TIGR01244 family)
MLNERQITKKLTIGGKPAEADVQDLKARGFRTVINLMMPDEPGALEEERLVENTGMSYSHIPVSPVTLDDAAVYRFDQAIDSSDGPVAVHCKGGGRASVMALLYLATKHQWTVDQTIAEGEKMGAKIGPDSPYREFVEEYVRRHSAGERTDLGT